MRRGPERLDHPEARTLRIDRQKWSSDMPAQCSISPESCRRDQPTWTGHCPFSITGNVYVSRGLGDDWSLWPRGRPAGTALITLGRSFVACIFVFYAVQHFLFPRFVPGVPLEKMTPAWMPAPVLLAYFVGITLFVSGVGLMVRRTRRTAAACAGTVLVLLSIFFYIPILATEIHSPLAVDGVNYVGDTLLFAATALLAGYGSESPRISELHV